MIAVLTAALVTTLAVLITWFWQLENQFKVPQDDIKIKLTLQDATTVQRIYTLP